MIELQAKPSVLIQKKKKEPEQKHQGIPFYCQDSIEVDFIRKKIQQNREYLAKCTSAAAYKKVEADTLFLENNILPVLLAQTNLFFNDAAKQFVSSLDKAVNNNFNSLLFYNPIKDEYAGPNPKLAIHNPRQNPDKLDNYVMVIAGNMGENADMFDWEDIDKY